MSVLLRDLPDVGLTWSGGADVEHYDDGSCDLVYRGMFRISGLSGVEAYALVVLLGARPEEGAGGESPREESR